MPRQSTTDLIVSLRLTIKVICVTLDVSTTKFLLLLSLRVLTYQKHIKLRPQRRLLLDKACSLNQNNTGATPFFPDARSSNQE